MRSQVTTKRGDDGTTVTLGGDRYPKSHPIVECSGHVDLVRAQTALCRLALLRSGRDDAEELGDFLFWLLHTLFLLGTQCNDPLEKHPELRKGELAEKHMERLEAMQEKLEAGVTLPRKFVVSASNELAGQFDMLRATVRELERSVVGLKEGVPEFHTGAILPFLNRLSDFLFVVARHVEDGRHTLVNYAVLEEGAEP